MAAITDLAAASSVAAGDQLAINQSGTDRRVTADKFARMNVANTGAVAANGGTLTISNGAITVTSNYHIVDTEGATATDDLTTINGGITGQWLFLRTANGARDVTLKNGTGNLILGADIALLTTGDCILLLCIGASWLKVAFGDN